MPRRSVSGGAGRLGAVAESQVDEHLEAPIPYAIIVRFDKVGT